MSSLIGGQGALSPWILNSFLKVLTTNAKPTVSTEVKIAQIVSIDNSYQCEVTDGNTVCKACTTGATINGPLAVGCIVKLSDWRVSILPFTDNNVVLCLAISGSIDIIGGYLGTINNVSQAVDLYENVTVQRILSNYTKQGLYKLIKGGSSTTATEIPVSNVRDTPRYGTTTTTAAATTIPTVLLSQKSNASSTATPASIIAPPTLIRPSFNIFAEINKIAKKQLSQQYQNENHRADNKDETAESGNVSAQKSDNGPRFVQGSIRNVLEESSSDESSDDEDDSVHQDEQEATSTDKQQYKVPPVNTYVRNNSKEKIIVPLPNMVPQNVAGESQLSALDSQTAANEFETQPLPVNGTHAIDTAQDVISPEVTEHLVNGLTEEVRGQDNAPLEEEEVNNDSLETQPVVPLNTPTVTETVTIISTTKVSITQTIKLEPESDINSEHTNVQIPLETPQELPHDSSADSQDSVVVVTKTQESTLRVANTSSAKGLAMDDTSEKSVSDSDKVVQENESASPDTTVETVDDDDFVSAMGSFGSVQTSQRAEATKSNRGTRTAATNDLVTNLQRIEGSHNEGSGSAQAQSHSNCNNNIKETTNKLTNDDENDDDGASEFFETQQSLNGRELLQMATQTTTNETRAKRLQEPYSILDSYTEPSRDLLDIIRSSSKKRRISSASRVVSISSYDAPYVDKSSGSRITNDNDAEAAVVSKSLPEYSYTRYGKTVSSPSWWQFRQASVVGRRHSATGSLTDELRGSRRSLCFDEC